MTADPPWFEAETPMTVHDISERLHCPLATARDWARQRLFGDPVSPSARRTELYRYAPRKVYLTGVRKGILDIDGSLIQAVRRGSHRLLKDEPKFDVDGMELKNVAQVAAMFGVLKRTVDTWIDRRKTRGLPRDFPTQDVREDGHSYWRLDTLTRWGKDTGRLDEEGNSILKTST